MRHSKAAICGGITGALDVFLKRSKGLHRALLLYSNNKDKGRKNGKDIGVGMRSPGHFTEPKQSKRACHGAAYSQIFWTIVSSFK
uniref:Uncharacterized protein n=1 Tax=Peronospora matthiolae TaxID=2874970 RepID=A0AAV1SZM1_9STRA